MMVTTQMALGKPRGAQIIPKGMIWVRDWQGRGNRVHYILVRNHQITKLIINNKWKATDKGIQS